jgi:hypothetical protein
MDSMNHRTRLRRAFQFALIILNWLAIWPASMSSAADADDDDPPTRRYGLEYRLVPDPKAGSVRVVLQLEQDSNLLREMSFDADRIEQIDGDGDLRRVDDRYTWQPPAAGGELSWRVNVRHKRNHSGYDAWLDESWGVFRAEDVIPRADTRVRKGARSDTEFEFDLPEDWSVITEYKEAKGRFLVAKPGRNFVQPSGWIVTGKLGVRREKIAGTRVAIAAPVEENVRRMDTLALLNWTLPELVRILPEPVPRLTIVSAGEPMWRGGLSAPQSLYMHAERPLISENGTSTLLHELMHVAMGASAKGGYDWIVEGFAEYYSLELLRRSGAISLPRYRAAMDDLQAWSSSAKVLCSRSSTGPETALAVTVLQALDEEIDEATDGDDDLDDVLSEMLEDDRKFTLDALRRESRDLIGKDPDSLRAKRLPGCSSSS